VLPVAASDAGCVETGQSVVPMRAHLSLLAARYGLRDIVEENSRRTGNILCETEITRITVFGKLVAISCVRFTRPWQYVIGTLQ